VRVGCRNTTGSNAYHFLGILDDVAFWNGKVLSPGEITTLYSAELNTVPALLADSSLKAYYRFESGFLTTDTTTNAHTLTAINYPVGLTTKFAGLVYLASQSAYSAVDHTDFKPTGNFTIGGWIKTTQTGYARFIFQSYSQNTNWAGFYFRISAGNKLYFVSGKNTGTILNTDYKAVTGSTTVTDDVWHFVVATYDGTNLNLYVDGKSDATAVAWAYPPNYAANNYVRVGVGNLNGSNSSYSLGAFDDIFLLNGRALTLADVQEIYYNSYYLTQETSDKLLQQTGDKIIIDGREFFEPTKSLKYTVFVTPTAPTKSLKYTVITTPTKQDKALTYSILRTITAIEKSLEYTVITTPAALEKSLEYQITASNLKVKDLIYSVITTPTEKTKSLKYTVIAPIPTAPTKSLKYTVEITKASVDKSLKYTVITTPTAPTKSLDYEVSSPVGITKSLKYTIITTRPLITDYLLQENGDFLLQETGYRIVLDKIPSADTPLTYTVIIVPGAITKLLTYMVVAPVPVTKSLKYTTTIVPGGITKSLKYTVIITPASVDKSLKYTVWATPAAKTKFLKYTTTIVIPAITKSLKYAVVYVPTAITKSLKYCVITTPAALTKALTYDVITTIAVTKSLKYTVWITLAAKTKRLDYRIILDAEETELYHSMNTTYTYHYHTEERKIITKVLQYVI
jgi:hypothetical protein